MAESSLIATAEPGVWEYHRDVLTLFARCAALYRWLEGEPDYLPPVSPAYFYGRHAGYDEPYESTADSTTTAADVRFGPSDVVESVNALVDLAKTVRQRELLLVYFARAYANLLNDYIAAENGRNWSRTRDKSSVGPAIEPLPAKYCCYHQKALEIVDGFLRPLVEAMTHDSNLDLDSINSAACWSLEFWDVDAFVANLQHEAVAAAELYSAEHERGQLLNLEAIRMKEQSNAHDTTGAESVDGNTIAVDLLTTSQIAKLALVTPKTVNERLRISRKSKDAPTPTVRGEGHQESSFSYAAIHPWLQKTWKKRKERFPEAFSDVKKILAASE